MRSTFFFFDSTKNFKKSPKIQSKFDYIFNPLNFYLKSPWKFISNPHAFFKWKFESQILIRNRKKSSCKQEEKKKTMRKSVRFGPFYAPKHFFSKNAQNQRIKLIFSKKPKFFYIILDFFNKFLTTWSWTIWR